MVTAFERWYTREFGQSEVAGTYYLMASISGAPLPPDSVIWTYLEKTGDKKYTLETFEKAHRLILEAAQTS